MHTIYITPQIAQDIAKVATSTNKHERAVLQAVELRIKDGILEACCTDGKLLLWATHEIATDEEFSALLPQALVKSIASVATAAAKSKAQWIRLDYRAEEQVMTASIDADLGMSLSGTTLTEMYPPWRNAIPNYGGRQPGEAVIAIALSARNLQILSKVYGDAELIFDFHGPIKSVCFEAVRGNPIKGIIMPVTLPE